MKKNALLLVIFLSACNDSDGYPPVIDREPMTIKVLSEPGSCTIHPLAEPVVCHRVKIPNEDIQDHFISGFDGRGPVKLRVYRLSYDWSKNEATHPVVPEFALIEKLD